MKKLNYKDMSTRNKTSVISKTSASGITLITLIVTIIVLLILAGITLALTIPESGLFSAAAESKEKTKKGEVREKLEMALMDASVEKVQNQNYNKADFLDQLIESEVPDCDVYDDIVEVGKYAFLIDRNKLIIIDEVTGQNLDKDLISRISTIADSGQRTIKINAKIGENEEEITYNLNVIVHDGDLILDGINNVDGATLGNNIYEFGDKETDVATATEYAKNMVVLKVNGNLTVNEGITLTACKSDAGYGGPKGMLIYCTGTVTNNGSISMTARGAKAEGENVYLWQNSDGSYEYVPAQGATGGASRYYKCTAYSSTDYYLVGLAGANGIARTTGGGGSGGLYARRNDYNSFVRTSGAGSVGTSYSGGTGGGGISTNYGGTYASQAGQPNGGAGGNAFAYRGNTSWAARNAGGGAGNSGGIGKHTASGQKGGANNATYYGKAGTGGLLIIYSNTFENTGTIQSNGSLGGTGIAGGGSSGGGSINIFAKEIIEEGTLTAIGGSSAGGTVSGLPARGGAGGNGTVSIGNISSGMYVPYE